jgi:hypothetical protein
MRRLTTKSKEMEAKKRDEELRARNVSNMIAALQQQLQQQQGMFMQISSKINCYCNC